MSSDDTNSGIAISDEQALEHGKDESTVDVRLNSLRETVLLLLDEVESLSISVPVDIKNGARFSDEVRQFEVNLIRTALGRTSGSQIRAAKLLGLKPTTLNAKIKRYNITPTGYHSQGDRSEVQQNAA
jgi:transcriptional regulator with GAF, ATPase, and Fis domain